MASEHSKPTEIGDGYEKRDASPGALALFAVVIIVTIAFGYFAAVVVFRVFAKTQSLGSPASPFAPARMLPPEPRLQSDPRLDLQHLRQAESNDMNSYGWVNQPAGTVRIPINQAMDRIMEKGLPVQGQQAGKK